MCDGVVNAIIYEQNSIKHHASWEYGKISSFALNTWIKAGGENVALVEKTTEKVIQVSDLKPNSISNPHCLKIGPALVNDDIVLHTGYLMIGKIFRAKRYCVLTKNLLYAFERKEVDPHEASPHLILQVNDVSLWNGENLDIPVSNPKETGLVLVNSATHILSPRKGKILAFAESQDDRNAWFEALYITIYEKKQVPSISMGTTKFEGDDNNPAAETTLLADQDELLKIADSSDGIYENQRLGKSGWGSRLPGHLLFSDPGKYSTKCNQYSVMRFDLTHWKIEKDPKTTDDEGWQYSNNFEDFLNNPKSSTVINPPSVRRRLWVKKNKTNPLYRLSNIGSGAVGAIRSISTQLYSSIFSPVSISSPPCTSLDWYLERIIREFNQDTDKQSNTLISERLQDFIEKVQRQLILLSNREYNEWDSIQLDEFLEDFSHSMKHGWTPNNNAMFILRPRLEKFIKQVIHGDISLLNSLSSKIANVSAPKKIPKLSIVMMVVGSRGDVQPFLAYALELHAFGHHVRIAAHEEFRPFITTHGIEFYPLAGDPHQIMASMVQHKQVLSLGMAIDHVKTKRPWIRNLLVSAWKACTVHENSDIPFQCDVIIANPPSFAGPHIAEKLGVPLHMCFTMPWTPTKTLQSPFFLYRLSAPRGKYLSYTLIDRSIWVGTKDLINQWRQDVLQLKPISNSTRLTREKYTPFTYCFSEYLIPRPNDWEPWIDVSGFWFLNETKKTNFDPPKELQEFLANGPPPVFVGFGSIVVKNPEKLTDTIVEALLKSGRRGIVQRGWAGIIGAQTTSSSILFIDSIPHDWLFEHVIAVVHHGGAGTTSAGLRAGKPTVIIPFFGDQFFWGSVVGDMGVGSEPIPYSKLRVDKLASAIERACSPEVVEKARLVGCKIRSENGVENAMKRLHSLLPLEVMTCDVDPTHKTAKIWNLTRSKQICVACYEENCVLNPDDNCFTYTFVDWSQGTSLGSPQRTLMSPLVIQKTMLENNA